MLEIGSGPGWDAGYLEGHGVQVIRTDATPAFVSLLRAAGHNARLLDARTDPLGGPYQGILANAVLHHLNRDQFEDVLRRARTAVAASGILGFTVKEGHGAAWSEHKLGLPRHFTYWRSRRCAPHCTAPAGRTPPYAMWPAGTTGSTSWPAPAPPGRRIQAPRTSTP